MRRKLFGGVAVALLAIGFAAPLAAQETGTPMFKAPYRGFTNYQFGFDITFPEGADFSLEGNYQFASGPHDFGLRGGINKCGDGCTLGLVGGNFRTRVLRATQQFPLDGAVTIGFGAQFGEGALAFAVPVGVSVGRQLAIQNSTVRFTPYVHPVLVPVFGDDVDSDVLFALGLGADIAINRYVAIKISGGIGDIEGIGLGLAFMR
jgi:hypothetical protein